MKRIIVLIFMLILSANSYCATSNHFNEYILKAVAELSSTRSELGYGPYAYTQNLRIGKAILKASGPPQTMCVAAQVEVISKALEIYERESGDRSGGLFLPATQWRSLGPGSLRGKIWMVEHSGSRGTADALSLFGMGEERPFSMLEPGGFINLNRQKTGHAVIFLGYIDKEGEVLSTYSSDVAGFKYFSAQGRNPGGLGYRYAFFEKFGCPSLPEGKKRDCGVIYSENSRILNAGHMFLPSLWNKKKRDLALKFSAATPKGFEGEFDAKFFDGMTTDD
jgi:hypothetical protein